MQRSSKIIALLIGFTAVFAFHSHLAAQRFEPPQPVGDAWKDPRSYRKFAQDKVNIIMGRKSMDDRDQFYDYYKSGLIARLTNPGQYGKDFAEIRREMLRDLIIAKVPQIRSDLMNLYVTELGAIAKGNFHPAARVNAVVILGALNSTERTPAGKPAVPYNAVFDDLKALYLSDTVPLGIRLAALMAVLRHVESDYLLLGDGQQPQVGAAAKTELATAAKTILAAEVPQDVEPRSWNYFRARTMDLYGSIVSATPSKDEVDFLISYAANPEEDMLLRSRAVFALSRQQYKAIQDVDGDATVGALVAYLADACQQTVDDVATFRKANLKRKEGIAGGGGLGGGGIFGGDDEGGGSSPGGGMSGGMYGPAGGGAAATGGIEAYENEMLRRQILYHIFSVQRALDGAGKRNPDLPGIEQFQSVPAYQNLVDQVKLLEETANNDKIDTDSLVTSIKRSRSELETLRSPAENTKPAVDPLFP